MNSDKRMAELYLERDEDKKHTYYVKASGVWVNKHPEAAFRYDTEYKLAPETLERAARNFDESPPEVSNGASFKAGAKWAWANPESKE